MGRASKWFRSLFSYLKSPDSSPANHNSDRRRGRRRSPSDVRDPLASPYAAGIDANRHAIAVAAATAAVAEAALTAAQAAAEVVRLTSGGRSGRGTPETSGDRRKAAAAVKIQSAFRAYLARRALKALKGLVKIQALVRGYIVRKQSTDMLRRMHAMARIQARASKHRSYPPESPPYGNNNFYNSHHSGITNPRRYEERSKSAVNSGFLTKPEHSRSHSGISTNTKENSQIASRWLNHWMEQCAREKSLHETSIDKRSDKILEVDTWKPHPSKPRTDQVTPTSHYFSAWNEPGPEYTKAAPVSRPSSKHHKPNPSISSEDDQVPACAADGSSPRGHSSASCRPAGNSRGPSLTPARSECSRSLFGEYIGGHPSYMANTESSRAKVRSYSAPKQRMQQAGLGLSGNFGRGDFWECSDTFSEKGSFFPASNRGGNYRHSGQVKRQGTPARDAGVGFSSVYGRRM